jgi:hypothetical protein
MDSASLTFVFPDTVTLKSLRELFDELENLSYQPAGPGDRVTELTFKAGVLQLELEKD